MGFVEEIYGPQIKEDQVTTVYEYENTPENRSWAGALPVKQGLYDPELEKDACGVGFAASVMQHGFAVTAEADFSTAISRASQATKSSAMVRSLSPHGCVVVH